MLKQHPSGRRRRLRERQLARTTWVNSELWQNISRKCLKDPPSDMLKRGQCWGVCANKDEGGGGVDILVDLMCRLPGRVNAIRHCKQSLETGNLRLWARACTRTRTHTPTLSCTVCPAISASHTKTHTLLYWSSSPASPVRSPHVERSRIDMWTAYYKSTSLKLNCAKPIAVQIPCWKPLILIINLLPHSHKKGSYSSHNGFGVIKSQAREIIP